MPKVEMTRREQDEVVMRGERWIAQDESDRASWYDNLKNWWRQYEGILDDKTFPWPNCSNMHIPMTKYYCLYHHSRTVQVLANPNFHISFHPVGKEDAEIAKFRDKLFNYLLRSHINEFRGAYNFFDKNDLDRVIFGRMVIMPIWEEQERTTLKRRRTRRPREIEESIYALDEGGLPRLNSSGDPIELGKRSIPMRDNKGRIIAEEVEEEYFEEEIIWEGVKLYKVDNEDILFPAGYTDINDCPHFARRFFKARKALKRLNGQSGWFNLDNEFIDSLSPTTKSEGTKGKVREEVGEEVGVMEEAESHPDQEAELELWEIFEREAEVDGRTVDMIWTVMADRLVRAQYLDERCPPGTQPIYIFGFQPIPRTLEFDGIPAMLEDIQEAINDIHNQKMDAVVISIAPPVFYRASSGIEPGALRFGPLAMNPVEDPSDIFIPQLPEKTILGYQAENEFMGLAERLLGISDYNLGRQPTLPNAPRTATQALSIMSEAGVRQQPYIKRFETTFRDLVWHIMELYRLNRPTGFLMRIVSEPEESYLAITDEDWEKVSGRFDVDVSVISKAANEQMQRDRAVFLYQTLVGNPLIATRPERLWALTKKFLEQFEEIDVSGILGPEPPAPKFIDPETENGMLIQGQTVMPKMGEDHSGHLETHYRVVSSSEFGSAPMNVRELFRTHIAETQRLQAAEMQAQGGIPSGLPGGPQPSTRGVFGATPSAASRQPMGGEEQAGAPLAGLENVAGTMRRQSGRGPI